MGTRFGFESMHGKAVLRAWAKILVAKTGLKNPHWSIALFCDTDVKDGQLPSSTGWNVSFVVKLMERPKIDWLFEDNKQVNTYS